MVEVVPPSQRQFTLTFMDNANSRNYLDPTLNQNIMCQQSQDTKAFINYIWNVTRITSNTVLFGGSGQSIPGIRSSSNALIVDKNTFSGSTEDFEVSCSATNLKYTGSVKKTYTTSLLLKVPVKLSISPSTGKVQDTLFTFQAKKPQG